MRDLQKKPDTKIYAGMNKEKDKIRMLEDGYDLMGTSAFQGEVIVHGIFAGVPYCIDLLNGSFIETHQDVVTAFRPKTK